MSVLVDKEMPYEPSFAIQFAHADTFGEDSDRPEHPEAVGSGVTSPA